jgi:NLR family CARD domain-containing protein 3
MRDHPHHQLGSTRKARPLQISVLAMVTLTACCAALMYLVRVAWENRDLDHAAVQANASALRSTNPAERLSAVRDMQQFGSRVSEIAVPALIGAMSDVSAEVRAAAAQAVGIVGRDQRRFGSGMSEIAMPALIGAMSDVSADVRAAAAQALGTVPSDATEAGAATTVLLRCLNDADPAVRIASAEALANLNAIKQGPGAPTLDSQPVLVALSEALGDQDTSVRLAALRAIPRVGPTMREFPPSRLIMALEDPSADNRAAAVAALVSYQKGLDRVMPLILRTFEKEEPRIRTAYLGALYSVKPPAITPTIIPLLIAARGSQDREVRCLVLRLLVSIGAESGAVVPALIDGLEDRMTPDLIDRSSDPVCEAASGLGQVAPRTIYADKAVEGLTKILRSGSPSRRKSAAWALGEFGRGASAAIPELCEALRQTQDKEDSLDYETPFARALGKIAPGTAVAEQAAQALTTALQARSEHTRAVAIEALRQLGPLSRAALPRFRAMEKDPSPRVRAAAAAAVEELSPAP